MSYTAQKIRLIHAIADILAEYEQWYEIDFILRQFGMRNSDSWDGPTGDKRSYVMNMVEYSDISDLEVLYEYLLEESSELRGPASEELLTASVKDCWSEAPFRVFISHSSKDKADVTLLKAILRHYGVTCFVAHEDIHPTEQWQEEILSGLESCHAIVAWATSDFATSFWAQQEMGIAMARRKLIVSVMNGGSPVGFISRQQGIQGVFKERALVDVAHEIINIFVQKSMHRKELQAGLIIGFEGSVSFEDARNKMTLLEMFDEWTEEDLNRLKAAGEENRQVADSHGVFTRIKGLYEKHVSFDQKDVAAEEEWPF